MNTKKTQQDLKVFTDYDKNKGKDTNWTKNDLKPATRNRPRTQTQQHKTEMKLYGTMRL